MSKRVGLLMVMALILATSFSIAQEDQDIEEPKAKKSFEGARPDLPGVLGLDLGFVWAPDLPNDMSSKLWPSIYFRGYYKWDLWLGKSNNPKYKGNELFLKMNGRKLYEYALKTVPQVVIESIDKAGIMLNNVKKILIHQANAKMDYAIVKRIFNLCKEFKIPKFIMPMIISKLGNSSVATVPILLNLLLKGRLKNHKLLPGQIAVLTSVGAGMNINCIAYRYNGS